MDMSRREMLTDVLASAAVAGVGFTAIGWVVVPKCAEAAPAGTARPAGAEASGKSLRSSQSIRHLPAPWNSSGVFSTA